MKKMYDFDDFDTAVSKDGISIQMEGSDFKLFGNELNRTGKDCKFPHISDIVEVCFQKGSTKMYWKEDLADEDYKQGEFTKIKFRKFIVSKGSIPAYDKPRGLNAKKTKEIIAKLGPMIPSEKLKFWIDMPTSENSADLTKNLDK